jgi:hypothetical protein
MIKISCTASLLKFTIPPLEKDVLCCHMHFKTRERSTRHTTKHNTYTWGHMSIANLKKYQAKIHYTDIKLFSVTEIGLLFAYVLNILKLYANQYVKLFSVLVLCRFTAPALT